MTCSVKASAGNSRGEQAQRSGLDAMLSMTQVPERLRIKQQHAREARRRYTSAHFQEAEAIELRHVEHRIDGK